MLLYVVFSTSSFAGEKQEVNIYNGETRVETSILTSRKVKSDTLVIANAHSFADSLSAYNIVSSKNVNTLSVKDFNSIKNYKFSIDTPLSSDEKKLSSIMHL